MFILFCALSSVSSYFYYVCFFLAELCYLLLCVVVVGCVVVGRVVVVGFVVVTGFDVKGSGRS